MLRNRRSNRPPGGGTLPPLPFGYCAGTFPEEHRDGVGGYDMLRDGRSARKAREGGSLPVPEDIIEQMYY